MKEGMDEEMMREMKEGKRMYEGNKDEINEWNKEGTNKGISKRRKGQMNEI